MNIYFTPGGCVYRQKHQRMLEDFYHFMKNPALPKHHITSPGFERLAIGNAKDCLACNLQAACSLIEFIDGDD